MKVNYYKEIKFIILALFLVFVAIGTVANFSLTEKEPRQNFSKDTQVNFEQIRDQLPGLVRAKGIGETLGFVQQTFKDESITIYHCHTLAHVVGHLVFVEEDLDKLLDYDIDFCEGGYKHGLEAQMVVTEGINYKEKLYDLCLKLKNISKVGDCYHGAGHEFMRQAQDASKAAIKCEELITNETISLQDCYKGIFSEFTNMAGGVDGQTGKTFPLGPLIVLKDHPLDVCGSLKELYQYACSLELNGLGISEASSDKDIEVALKKCIEGEHKRELKLGCLQSVAAVGAQHQLPKSTSIKPPDFIHDLESDLRGAYLAGAATEMKQFLQSGQEKDWESFCSFFDGDDKYFCEGVFKS